LSTGVIKIIGKLLLILADLEIAHDLGFSEEFYFSRFFNPNADVSPQLFRNTVGYPKLEV